MLDVVTRLLDTEADLVVTVTAPLDRTRPNNDKDRISLRNLVAEAKDRLLEATSGERAELLTRQIDEAAARVDLGAGALGYVIVATEHGSETHPLPFPVVEAVTLGRTPATRSLIQGLRRSARYRLLVISDKATRLFEGLRDDLREDGFPLTAAVKPRDLRAIAGRFARQPGRDDKEQWRNFYRDVDAGLTAVIDDDPLPLVLAGVDVSTTMFEDVSANMSSVIGRISGAHDATSAHDLGAMAWPLLRDNLEQRRHEVIAELTAAAHTQRAVTGIDEVWQFAREGRGQMLVVEENYRAEPAVEVDHRLVPTDAARPEAIGDPVDELIEHVVRAGGSVEFVAPDSLVTLDRVGLILR